LCLFKQNHVELRSLQTTVIVDHSCNTDLLLAVFLDLLSWNELPQLSTV